MQWMYFQGGEESSVVSWGNAALHGSSVETEGSGRKERKTLI